MKYVIDSLSKCSPRSGHFQKNDSILHLPMLLQYTKCAIVPYLSKEVFNYVTTDAQGYSICLDTTINMVDALSAYRKGIASFSGIGSDGISFLTIKNPTVVNKTADHGDTKDTMSIYARSGRKIISANQYMDLVSSHHPDVFHSLCDGETNATSSKRRIMKSMDRSKAFLEICLQRYRQSESLKSGSLFVAAIEGGYNLRHREEYIKEILVHNSDIHGYFLDGLHSNGFTATSLTIDNIKEIVKKCNELLPADKFKVMFGPYNPVVMLQLIQLGVDVFDSSYCYIATKNRCALTFSFDMESSSNGRDFDMDLKDPKYKEDFSAVLSGCNCLTCQKHTRAYIHHLINTKELLASILLMIHNSHHFIEFFKTIRQSIASGNFQELIDFVKAQFDRRCLLDENIQKIVELDEVTKKGKKTVSSDELSLS
ncbi:Queuine tRNA-ribosyltransferase accessory subunit 2 [Pseudolycoriella hygida]|uniref:Queuine tRNA-ribosyltransferase accessory subunit 2 n=1 Tax=Pseudolycoriella hygida TaxID=35572 RepID=A0A9Q0RYA7_9DIPT|nr:Queuine tRNA-ribosyltransferase accessory subunit 2 [Pseudolycoriella hygida]